MPFQGAGVPRFYIDNLSWLKANGVYIEEENIKVGSDMNEHFEAEFEYNTDGAAFTYVADFPKKMQFNFVAYLDHTFSSVETLLRFVKIQGGSVVPMVTALINPNQISTAANAYYKAEYNGFSILELHDSTGFSTLGFELNLKHIYVKAWGPDILDVGAPPIRLGCSAFLLGKYYDMPVSPNMEVKLERRHDGIKRIRTRGGSDLIDLNYIRPKPWLKNRNWTLSYPQPTPTGGPAVYHEPYEGDMPPTPSSQMYSCEGYAKPEIIGLTPQEVSDTILESYQILEYPNNATNGISAVDIGMGGTPNWISMGTPNFTFQEGMHYRQDGWTGDLLGLEESPNIEGQESQILITGSEDADDPDWYYETMNPNVARTGRKVWHLKFSQISDTDLWPQISALTTAGTTIEQYNSLLDSSNFFTDLVIKTNFGKIPFIFQPNNKDFNIDQFSLAYLDMDSLKLDQVAHRLFNISLDVVETW